MTPEWFEDRCGKVRFPTKRSAGIALRRIESNPRSRSFARNLYECDVCCGWHLTATPKSRLGRPRSKRGRRQS